MCGQRAHSQPACGSLARMNDSIEQWKHGRLIWTSRWSIHLRPILCLVFAVSNSVASSALTAEYMSAIADRSKLYTATQALVKLEILESALDEFRFNLGAQRSEIHPKRHAKLIGLTSPKGQTLNSKLVQVVAFERQSQRFQCRLESEDGDGEWMKIALANLDLLITCADFDAQEEASSKILSMRGELRSKVEAGMSSEIVDGCLKVQHISEDIGVGYFATRNIKRGAILLVDTAFASADTREGGDAVSQNLAICLQKKTEDISSARFLNESVLTLHAGGFRSDPELAGTEEEAEMKLRWIVNTNQFLCIQAQHLVSLFPAASRFNHACRPNAFVDSTGQVAIVRAIDDIAEGAEVLISYVPLLETLDARRRQLGGKGIACCCDRCEEEDRAAAQDEMAPGLEERRQLLLGVCELLRSPAASEQSPEQLIGEVERVVEAAEREPGGMQASNPLLNTVLNNLAHLHYFSATHGGGGQAAMRKFIACKVKSIQGLRDLWGQGTPPCLSYVLQLYRMLLGTFESASQRAQYERQLREACLLLFALDEPPPALTQHIGK